MDALTANEQYDGQADGVPDNTMPLAVFCWPRRHKDNDIFAKKNGNNKPKSLISVHKKNGEDGYYFQNENRLRTKNVFFPGEQNKK